MHWTALFMRPFDRMVDRPVPLVHPDGVRWDNDIMAERFGLLLRHYGDAMAVVEILQWGRRFSAAEIASV